MSSQPGDTPRTSSDRVNPPWAANGVRPGLPGFNTPQPTVPLSYVGIPTVSFGITPEVPLWRRTGGPQVTDQQVQHVLQSQQLTSGARAPVVNRFTPHLSRHRLPISTAFSNSAQPAARLTMETEPAGTTSLDLVLGRLLSWWRKYANRGGRINRTPTQQQQPQNNRTSKQMLARTCERTLA